MKNVRTLGILAPLVFPLLFSNPAVTTIAVFTLIFAGAVVGWNVFSGYTG
jgi:branched-chain amino acid transport system permease protein